MSVVTHYPDDPPGTTLLKHEQELRIQHPHLSAEHARQLIKEQHPDLWALHHQGIADPADAAPTIDPGVAINELAHRLLKSGEARNFTQACELAMRRLPEHAAAYAQGLRMPAASARANVEPAPPARSSSDPGTELMRLVQERITTNPTLTIRDAQAAVLAADPQLARHYSEGSPLPVAKRKVAVTEQMVADALLEHRRLEAEIARLQGTTRHYNDLSEAEKARTPLRQHERRLRSGDKLKPGETLCMKMSPADLGGGSFAVMGA